jgi:hypothetical protein
MADQVKLDPAEIREQLGFMDDERTAAFLNIGVPTLKNRRAQGNAPPSSKIGRDHLTSIEDCKRWVARRKRAG